MEGLNTDYTYTETENADLLLVTYGRVYSAVYQAHTTCARSGYRSSLLKLTRIFPLDSEFAEIAAGYRTVIFFEEGIGNGGISSLFGTLLAESGYKGRYVRIAADDFLKQAPVPSILDKLDLSEHAVCRYIYTYGHKS
jgi:1-deoxy-D-xylulose-5-phosphate synthase